MPSKWDTSGVDWLNVRNSRQDVVVYELAQATAELYRYAFRETLSLSSVALPPNYDNINFRIRQETCFIYICNTIKRMFSEDESYFDGDGRPLGTKCFISDNTSPNIVPTWFQVSSPSNIRYNDYMMGIPTLDISQGGELESNCGDLSFLRDDYKGRITHEMLQSIYNILTYPKKCICTPFVKEAESQYLTTTPRVSFFISRFYTALAMNGGGGLNSNVNTAIDRMYSNQDNVILNQYDNIAFSVFRLRDLSGSTAINNTYDIYSGNSLRSSIANGAIDINDLRLDIIKWSVVRDEFGTQTFDVYPNDSPYMINTNRVNDIDLVPNDSTFLGDTFSWDTRSSPISSGLPTLPTSVGYSRREEIYETGIAIAKLDIKGYMDYYTE